MNKSKESKAKELFDDSVDRLDAATLSRLNQGRHAALDVLQGSQPVGLWGRWVPATGVAAAARKGCIQRGRFQIPPPWSFSALA